MLKAAPALLCWSLLLAGPAAAQQGPSEGELLYAQNCALCHGDSGTGDPPTFPALEGNDRLGDQDRVVRSIHEGGRRMPPFPALTTDEVSSLAGFVRTAWTNDFGLVTADEVTAALGAAAPASAMASIADGVFTEPQARRGEEVYTGACAICHGYRLNGAPDDPDMRSTPPLARARFLRVWDGRSLGTLFAYTRATMPEDNPDSLTDQEYADVIAYMLSVGGMPAGDDELQPDLHSLAQVIVRP